MERSIWKRSTLEAQGAKNFELIKPALGGYLFKVRYCSGGLSCFSLG